MPQARSSTLTSITEPRLPNERPLLVVIIGPTAVGKTALSIDVARAMGCEIINADSRQVYRGMPIGTAQPTAAERAAVPHHFVDFIAPDTLYSAGQFESDAMAQLQDWFSTRRCAVMSGGSGLYVKAVLEGLDPVPADLAIRTTLNERLVAEGLEPLVEQLRTLDPEHAAKMDTQNPQRVVRALEVCLASGQPFSSFHSAGAADRPFDTWIIGLNRDRAELIERINLRVDAMMAEGLEAEVKSLEAYWNENALQTVGYREWKQFFAGEASQAEVAEEIKLRTRQFAKRQMTWFQRMEDVHWFHPDTSENIMEALRVECAHRGWEPLAPSTANHGK